MRRVTILVLLLLLADAKPALAKSERETFGGATVDETSGSISVDAGLIERSGGGGDAGGTGPGGGDIPEWMPPFGNGNPFGGGGCRVPLGSGVDQLFCDPEPSAAGSGPVVDPGVLAAEAHGRLVLPSPEIRLNPAPPRDQLVNLATWLWLDGSSWSSRSAQASVPGVSVTVSARPERVIWDMGDGHQVVCHGPGTPYDTTRPAAAQRTDCSHTYRRSSAGVPGEHYVITATVEWSAAWSVAGAPGGGSLPLLRRSSSQPVRVAEAQAINR